MLLVLVRFSRKRRFFIHLIWLDTVWLVWGESNHHCFHQKEELLSKISICIKVITLRWVKVGKPGFDFDIHNWWINLLSCNG